MSDEITSHEVEAAARMSKEIREEEDERVSAVLDKLYARNPESFAAMVARMDAQPMRVGEMLMSEASYRDVVNLSIANSVADEERGAHPHSMGAMVEDRPCPECADHCVHLTPEDRESLIRLGRQSGKTGMITDLMRHDPEAVLMVGHREGMSRSAAEAVFHASYGPPETFDLKALRAAAEAKQRMMDAMENLTSEEIPLVQSRTAPPVPSTEQSAEGSPRPAVGRNTGVNPYHQEADAAKFQRYDWDSQTDHRDRLVAKYAWAIPNDNAIRLLAGMGPIIEMGAGNGYWAKLIVDAGGKVESYDVKPGQHHYNAVPRTVWYPVLDGGPDQITVRHKDHVLLLVWPPYEGALAFDALTRYLEIGGKTVVFVGESQGGCTADDRFFNLLRARFEEVGDTDIPQWDGIHDYLTVYQRKTDR